MVGQLPAIRRLGVLQLDVRVGGSEAVGLEGGDRSRRFAAQLVDGEESEPAGSSGPTTGEIA